MENTRGMNEIASAMMRAVSSFFPPKYVTIAPRAGARSMIERMGRSRTTHGTPRRAVRVRA